MDDTEIKAQDGDIKIVVCGDLNDYKTIDELLPRKKDYIYYYIRQKQKTRGNGSPYVVIMITCIILIVMESLQMSLRNRILKE